MNFTFSIEYHTVWGESVGLVLNNETDAPVLLSTTNGYEWTVTIDKPMPDHTPLTYYYAIYRDGRCVREEYRGLSRMFYPTGQSSRYIVRDSWRDLPAASYLFSSAFSGNHSPKAYVAPASTGLRRLTLRAVCPCLHRKNLVLGVCGESELLGSWNTDRALRMQEMQRDTWAVTIDLPAQPLTLQYKFVACDARTGKVVEWEAQGNRQWSLPALAEGEHYLTPEVEVSFASAWRKLAGTAIPVFSLRSEGSFGVGDFGDLKRMVDWIVKTHQQALQILPINDTTITHTWTDSYPYNSISIYAFHPMYVDLRQIGTLRDKEALARFEAKRVELNALEQVDYEEVNRVKREYLWLMYRQSGKRLLSSVAFRRFYTENEHWLRPYAAFSFLRDRFGTPDYRTWPEHGVYNADKIAALCAPESDSYTQIAFYYYVQYHLHAQLLEAGDYARAKGVILKGDIPIGISRNSVEAWMEPYYFNMNGQAGAPPDAFSAKGQNWGFPTYNWEVMENDHYRWWRKRFSKMAEYFTAYRIDHILGFFRIWEIPTHSVHGLLGQFSPALPMTVDEIESYGLRFQRDFMTLPFINEDILYRTFGDKADYVKRIFLNHSHDDIYRMKPEFDTQRKVEAFFADKPETEQRNLREGVYSLISNVLFVPDRTDASMYHPRIAVQTDFIFERLTWEEKEAFNRLYNQYFYRRHNEFWYHEAMKKLPVLTQATRMLVCGEDLGMVPDCVPWVMDNLQILSLEIQRMPKNPKHEFGHLWEYPYRSVCTISTHDMATLRGWWEEDRDQTSRYYYHALGQQGEVPAEATPRICEEVVSRHLDCPSMLCILSFQDWLSIDGRARYADARSERINVPAIPRYYWRYRMHLTLEELMANDQLNQKIAFLIDRSGRDE